MESCSIFFYMFLNENDDVKYVYELTPDELIKVSYNNTEQEIQS